MWICDQDAPRSFDEANQRSPLRTASPGTSLRRSYQVMPTVPFKSTPTAGSNAWPPTPGSVDVLQVRPPSRDLETTITPRVAERLASTVT